MTPERVGEEQWNNGGLGKEDDGYSRAFSLTSENYLPSAQSRPHVALVEAELFDTQTELQTERAVHVAALTDLLSQGEKLKTAFTEQKKQSDTVVEDLKEELAREHASNESLRESISNYAQEREIAAILLMIR